MAEEKRNMEEVRKVNHLHLVYIIIIFVIVLLAIWLASPYIVCEESLVKFEFAATITSIVLALVSIVYSMSSGQGISENLGSMRNASEKIGTVGDKLETIQTSLQAEISHLTNLEQKMQALHDKTDRTNQLINEMGLNNNITSTSGNEGKFDYENSSVSGLLIVYACSLAYKKGKPFPAEFTGNPFYAHGYITALEISASKHFRALTYMNGVITVTKFDTDYFGKATDVDYISAQMQGKSGYVQAQEALEKINQFYGVN